MSFSSLACSLFILTPILSVYGQQQSMLSKKEIMVWADRKEWANGLRLNLHRSVNEDSFYVAYHRNPNAWTAAFAFLKNFNVGELKPGNYPILGDQVFALVTEGPSHSKDSVKWESHKHYIDLHYIIKGREMIGIVDTAKATMTKPYTPDVINYTAEGRFYIAKPGEFFLFFPNDAHRPSIKLDGYDIVKKIVIKIATGY
jgi:biofilm protein TabA